MCPQLWSLKRFLGFFKQRRHKCQFGIKSREIGHEPNNTVNDICELLECGAIFEVVDGSKTGNLGLKQNQMYQFL